MPDPSLPSAKSVIHVDTRGAVILTEESPETRDSRGIYLPNHVEPVSHIAVDVGGSLAKVVYFTRSPDPPPSPQSAAATQGSTTPGDISDIATPVNATPPRTPSPHDDSSPASSSMLPRNGALTPLALDPAHDADELDSLGALLRRRAATTQHFPGGSLNFVRFETSNIGACVEYLQALISHSAELNRVPIAQMRASVKIMATGGGAHKFYEVFRHALGVEVRKEDEMECLIEGLKFITMIPDEVYYFSDEVIRHGMAAHMAGPPPPGELERPSPNPPEYAVTFAHEPTPQLPCLLVNIGSGVSIIKVDEDGKFERVSGTSLGGGTLWGLLSLLTPATTFDEMLAFSQKGDNASVDMLVGDIYGQDYSRLGLKSTTIASSFGKVFKHGGVDKGKFKPEDISKSLLYAVSNNIGQIAYMNAEKYNLDRIYFGGCFIRGHAATIATLSYAIRFWSKGTKRAYFLRHEGFLGSIGAWIKNISSEEQEQ